MTITNKLKGFRFFCKILTVIFVLSGCGAKVLKPDIDAGVTKSSGKQVRLSYAGPQAVDEMFCINEIVSVYDQRGNNYVEVGKLKVLRKIDRNNLAALVVEGKVKIGDEARKSIAACMVRPLLPQHP